MVDYEFAIYHCKVNIMLDALSRKSMVMYLTQQKELLHDKPRFAS